MKFKEFILKTIQSHSGISSKRVCGIAGWLVCLCILVYCAIKQTQAPNAIDNIIYACMGLLGIDSITGIWKDKK